MKSSFKKGSAILSLVLTLGVVMTSPVMAANLSRTYSGQFTNDWSKVVSYGVAELEYGFNTWLINEDTCYANNNNSNHYAKIRNGSGVHVGSSKSAGSWSKIEVQHSGSTVTYSCEW